MIRLDEDETIYLKSKIDNAMHIVSGLIRENGTCDSGAFHTSKNVLFDISFDTIEGQFELDNLYRLNDYWRAYLSQYNEIINNHENQ